MSIEKKHAQSNIVIGLFGLAVIAGTTYYFLRNNLLGSITIYIFYGGAVLSTLGNLWAIFASIFQKKPLQLGRNKSIASASISLWILLCMTLKFF